MNNKRKTAERPDVRAAGGERVYRWLDRGGRRGSDLFNGLISLIIN